MTGSARVPMLAKKAASPSAKRLWMAGSFGWRPRCCKSAGRWHPGFVADRPSRWQRRHGRRCTAYVVHPASFAQFEEGRAHCSCQCRRGRKSTIALYGLPCWHLARGGVVVGESGVSHRVKLGGSNCHHLGNRGPRKSREPPVVQPCGSGVRRRLMRCSAIALVNVCSLPPSGAGQGRRSHRGWASSLAY